MPLVLLIKYKNKLGKLININGPAHVVVVVVIFVFVWYCPLSRDGWIYPSPSTIALTLFFTLVDSRHPPPIFSVSSSTCFFQVFFGCLHFLLSLTSRSRPTLKILSSSLLSTCPYHLTPFAVANWSITSFNSSMSICSSVVFLYKTF